MELQEVFTALVQARRTPLGGEDMRRTARFLLYTLRPWLLILPISVTSAVLLLPRLAGGQTALLPPSVTLCPASACCSC